MDKLSLVLLIGGVVVVAILFTWFRGSIIQIIAKGMIHFVIGGFILYFVNMFT